MSRARVNWTVPPGALYDAFDVYVKPQDAREWELRASTSGTSQELSFPDYGGFDIAVCPKIRGTPLLPSSWTYLTFAADTPDGIDTPSAVSNFRAAQEGNSIVCSWDQSTDKRIDHYEIRWGSSWEAGLVVARAAAIRNEVRFNPWGTGSVSLNIKARTKAGRESSATAVAITVRADEYGPVQGTHDEHGGGYTGTKTNVEVNGGNLRQQFQPATGNDWTGVGTSYDWCPFGTVISGGTYVTGWQDAGSVVDERVEIAPTITLTKVAGTGADWNEVVRPEILGSGSAVSPGTRSLYSYVSGNGTIIDGPEIRVDIDTAQDAVPTPDGWRRWVPGAVYRFREVRLRFTFVCPWQFAYLKTTALTWYRRRQNRKDEGTVTITGTGGTDITFASGRFTAAPYVTGNLIHASQVSIVTFSNVAAGSCKVRIWDAAGSEQSSGTVHWNALGI